MRSTATEGLVLALALIPSLARCEPRVWQDEIPTVLGHRMTPFQQERRLR